MHELPSLCQVAMTLSPSKDSEIKVVVWMPTTRWNGKFQGVGNGGWSGEISYDGLESAVR